MALRVGPIGLVLEAAGLGWVYLDALTGVWAEPVRTGGGGHKLGVLLRKGGCPQFTGGQLTTNLELVRTRGLRLFN